MDAVPTLARAAEEILAPAKRAPRARSADMAIVDMSRWTERSRGRRWCAPMRLSGGEARVLEWLPKRHRRSFEETRGASSARAGQVCKFCHNLHTGEIRVMKCAPRF